MVLVLAVTGCAATASAGLATEEVTPGTCRMKSTAEEMVSPSDVSPPVSCSAPHTLEAYAVSTAPASLSALGPERPGPEVLAAHSEGLCPVAPIRPYLGATDLDNQWGINVWVKFPTRAEWADGVRTVVCDLVVSAPAGQVPWIDVPLEGVMAYRDSDRVRLCRTGADVAEWTTCDQPHTGERVGDVDASLSVAGRQQACAALAERYVGAPLGEGLTAGVTVGDLGVAECWIDHHDGPVLGTVRGGLVAR